MELITIKPHHFMDIIKLYGSGIEVFVPDKRMGHDFYRVANEIIANPSVSLRLTVDGDDICKPCRKYHNICTDALTHIPGYTDKDTYNRTLDSRILYLYHLNEETYTALQLCTILYENADYIFKVWKEEEDSITQRRYDLFTGGAQKYLQRK